MNKQKGKLQSNNQRGMQHSRGSRPRGRRQDLGRLQRANDGNLSKEQQPFQRGLQSRSWNRGQRRGRGRGGQNRQTFLAKGISPLNRINEIELKTNLKTYKFQGQSWSSFRSIARGLGSRGGSIRQKQLQAIQAVHKAKSNLSQINAEMRRQNFINKNRGVQFAEKLSVQSLSRFRGRGRVRGRGRYDGRIVGMQRNWMQRRQLNQRFSGSTLSLKSNSSLWSAGTFVENPQRGHQMPWQGSQSQLDKDSIMTISVNNSPRSQTRNSLPKPTLQQKVANLKPLVSQKYEYNTSSFSQGYTGMSLNDRFSEDAAAGDRQVFF